MFSSFTSRGDFTSSFPVWMPYISFSCPLALASIPDPWTRRVERVGVPTLLAAEDPQIIYSQFIVNFPNLQVCIQRCNQLPTAQHYCIYRALQAVRWWRVCLPRQEAQVLPLGREGPGGSGHPLQYPCLDRAAWQATVPGVTKSRDTAEWLSTAHTLSTNNKCAYKWTHVVLTHIAQVPTVLPVEETVWVDILVSHWILAEKLSVFSTDHAAG